MMSTEKVAHGIAQGWRELVAAGDVKAVERVVKALERNGGEPHYMLAVAIFRSKARGGK
ncbi:MAG: hypothetical protein ACKVW3_01755 [Phycisphaerales bacterium]